MSCTHGQHTPTKIGDCYYVQSKKRLRNLCFHLASENGNVMFELRMSPHSQGIESWSMSYLEVRHAAGGWLGHSILWSLEANFSHAENPAFKTGARNDGLLNDQGPRFGHALWSGWVGRKRWFALRQSNVAMENPWAKLINQCWKAGKMISFGMALFQQTTRFITRGYTMTLQISKPRP